MGKKSKQDLADEQYEADLTTTIKILMEEIEGKMVTLRTIAAQGNGRQLIAVHILAQVLAGLNRDMKLG